MKKVNSLKSITYNYQLSRCIKIYDGQCHPLDHKDRQLALAAYLQTCRTLIRGAQNLVTVEGITTGWFPSTERFMADIT